MGSVSTPKPLLNFADKITLLSENGAKTVLVPMENLNEMTTLPQSILGKTDVPFYGNSQIWQKTVWAANSGKRWLYCYAYLYHSWGASIMDGDGKLYSN